MAEAATYGGGSVGRPRVQPGPAGGFQIHPRNRRVDSSCVLAEVFSSGPAARYLVLDFSGDEPPARPISRRGTGSVIRGVRVIHGVLPGHDLRPNLPHAGNVAAVSLREICFKARHRTWFMPHCDWNAD